MRLATIATDRGPRLHVKARSGYVDVGEATGDERMSSLQHVLTAGDRAMDGIRPLADRDGREAGESKKTLKTLIPGGRPAGALRVPTVTNVTGSTSFRRVVRPSGEDLPSGFARIPMLRKSA